MSFLKHKLAHVRSLQRSKQQWFLVTSTLMQPYRAPRPDGAVMSVSVKIELSPHNR